ncbi:hypothetical protein EBZ37_04030 [bacterium]|nr:hypothetical protein [bacterium]
MSTKKRFEQIEPQAPSDQKKSSFLGKLSFRRKIELEGVAREHIPDPPAPVATPEVKVTHVYQTEEVEATPTAEVEPNWDSLVRDIEIAEDRKHKREAEMKATREKKITEAEIQERIQTLKVRAETAKIKLIAGLIVVPVVLYICFHLFQFLSNMRHSSLRHGSGASYALYIFISVLASLAGVAGRRRRW